MATALLRPSNGIMSRPVPSGHPLLAVRDLSHSYGPRLGCDGISFEIYPGEVLAVVGESGSGKSTLLNCLACQLAPSRGRMDYRAATGEVCDPARLDETALLKLRRAEWGFVHQNPADGLMMTLSAGANIAERLLANGARHYARIRASIEEWMVRVELDPARIDERPSAFSGGMRQRLQIARNLVTGPRLLFMDEPTGGLDVSVQARLLDLIRGLVQSMGLSSVIVTHDLAVARSLSQRMIVMRHGRIVEAGLTDQILEDPQSAYAQLLVSSILQG